MWRYSALRIAQATSCGSSTVPLARIQAPRVLPLARAQGRWVSGAVHTEDFSTEPLQGEAPSLPDNVFQEAKAAVARVGESLSDDLIHRVFSYSSTGGSMNNGKLAQLGESLTKLYANEYLYFTFPNLPEEAMKKITSHFTSTTNMNVIGRQLGFEQAIHAGTDLEGQPLKVTGKAISSSLLALMGALHVDQGSAQAQSFIRDFILHRLQAANFDQFVKLEHPRMMLTHILSSLGKNAPVTRVLHESGRVSHLPTFVVGVFVDDQLLGEGAGYSLSTAEHEAIQEVLAQHFAMQMADAPLPSELENYLPEHKIKLLEKAESNDDTEPEQQ